jgi:hypothetical protein
MINISTCWLIPNVQHPSPESSEQSWWQPLSAQPEFRKMGRTMGRAAHIVRLGSLLKLFVTEESAVIMADNGGGAISA